MVWAGPLVVSVGGATVRLRSLVDTGGLVESVWSLEEGVVSLAAMASNAEESCLRAWVGVVSEGAEQEVGILLEAGNEEEEERSCW